MLATFAVWLFILLPVGQQLKPVEKNDTAHQHAEKASASIVVSEETHRHDDAAAADNKKRAADKPPVSPGPQQSCRLWAWVKSLSNADLSLIVNALYLLATVGILLAMLKSNKHAEKTYQESKNAAEEDRKLLRRQLEAYDRPWLTVSMSPGKSDRKFEQFGFYKGGDAYVWFGLKVTNIGKSLATNVTVTARLIAFKDEIKDLPKELETAKPMHTGEFTLFPEEFNDGLFNYRNTPIAEVEAVCFQLAEGGEVFVDMALIGRVVYRFATSDDPHHTDFAYKIARRVGDNVMPFVIVGNKLWSDEVEWLKLPGDHAN